MSLPEFRGIDVIVYVTVVLVRSETSVYVSGKPLGVTPEHSVRLIPLSGPCLLPAGGGHLLVGVAFLLRNVPAFKGEVAVFAHSPPLCFHLVTAPDAVGVTVYPVPLLRRQGSVRYKLFQLLKTVAFILFPPLRLLQSLPVLIGVVEVGIHQTHLPHLPAQLVIGFQKLVRRLIGFCICVLPELVSVPLQPVHVSFKGQCGIVHRRTVLFHILFFLPPGIYLVRGACRPPEGFIQLQPPHVQIRPGLVFLRGDSRGGLYFFPFIVFRNSSHSFSFPPLPSPWRAFYRMCYLLCYFLHYLLNYHFLCFSSNHPFCKGPCILHNSPFY